MLTWTQGSHKAAQFWKTPSFVICITCHYLLQLIQMDEHADPGQSLLREESRVIIDAVGLRGI